MLPTQAVLAQASTTGRALPMWKVQSTKIRQDLASRLSHSERLSKPWSAAGFQLRGLGSQGQNPRVLETLDLAVLAYADKENIVSCTPQSEHGRACLQAACSELYTDVSQNPGRKAFTCPSTGVSKCLTTSSHVYGRGRDRTILGLEQMMWQGHSLETKFPSSMGQSSIKSLSGEGICLPCLGLLFYALHHTDSLCV